MIFDKQTLFSLSQAIVATAASTNVIDLGVAQTPKHAKGPIHRDLGAGRDVPLRIQVVEDFDNLTTLTVTLEADDDENFGSPTAVAEITVALDALVAGYVVAPQYVPQGVKERYLRLNYTVVGTAPTAGAITAGLVFGNESWGA